MHVSSLRSRPYFLVSLLLGALAVFGPGCKPKSNAAALKDISGTNENGKRVSLAFLAIRNATLADQVLASSTEDDAVYARKLLQQPMFALVECADFESGEKLVESGASMLARLKLLSFMSNLFIDEDRALISFQASSEEKQKRNDLDQKVQHACSIKSFRMLSYPIIEDVFVRMNGLPDSKPSDAAKLNAAKKTYLAAQSVYLALRDNYDPTKKADESLMVAKLRQMAEEYGDTEREDFRASLAAADPFYNPCLEGGDDQLPWWVKEFKSAYSCIDQRGSDKVKTFAPGGGAKDRYLAVRDMLASEILDTHYEIFPDKGSGVYALWDLISSLKPWSAAAGVQKELAGFLKTPTTAAAFLKILAKLKDGKFLATANAGGGGSGPALGLTGLGLAGPQKKSGSTLGFGNRNRGKVGAGKGKTGGNAGKNGGNKPPPGGDKKPPPGNKPNEDKMGKINITDQKSEGTGADQVVRVGDESFFPKGSTKFNGNDSKNFQFDEHQEGADLYTNKGGDRRWAVDDKLIQEGKANGVLTAEEIKSHETKWDKKTEGGKTVYDHKETSDFSKGTFTEKMNEANTEMMYKSEPIKDKSGKVIAEGFDIKGPMATNKYNIATPDQATQNKIVDALDKQNNAVMKDIDRNTEDSLKNIQGACKASPKELQEMKDKAKAENIKQGEEMDKRLQAASEHSRLDGDHKKRIEKEREELKARIAADNAKIDAAQTKCGGGPLPVKADGGDAKDPGPAAGGGNPDGKIGLRLTDGDEECPNKDAEKSGDAEKRGDAEKSGDAKKDEAAEKEKAAMEEQREKGASAGAAGDKPDEKKDEGKKDGDASGPKAESNAADKTETKAENTGVAPVEPSATSQPQDGAPTQQSSSEPSPASPPASESEPEPTPEPESTAEPEPT